MPPTFLADTGKSLKIPSVKGWKVLSHNSSGLSIFFSWSRDPL